METGEEFVRIAALLCEPARATMCWNLLDGRAYTAGELSMVAGISATAASNHLSKLLEAGMIKVEVQGRHRYYSLAGAAVAYAVEGLAQLAQHRSVAAVKPRQPAGIKYCRTCYDHLAGFVGVSLVEALEKKTCLVKKGSLYRVTGKGWDWFRQLGIEKDDFTRSRRPLTRQCLDWSERRPHLAGQLGAALLSSMLQKKWFKPSSFSREMIVTVTGRKELYSLLGIALQ
jgi:DNA-binding transcriptional ArsR family regulator